MSTVGQLARSSGMSTGSRSSGQTFTKRPEQVHRDRVDLGHEEQRHADEVDHVGVDQRLEAAPPEVAQREVAREQHEHQPPRVAPRPREAPDGEEQPHAHPARDELHQRAEVRLAQVDHVRQQPGRRTAAARCSAGTCPRPVKDGRPYSAPADGDAGYGRAVGVGIARHAPTAERAWMRRVRAPWCRPWRSAFEPGRCGRPLRCAWRVRRLRLACGLRHGRRAPFTEPAFASW